MRCVEPDMHPSHPIRTLLLASSFLLANACATTKPASPTDIDTLEAQLPPIPARLGPLHLKIEYPAAGSIRPPVDSTFLFGTTGSGAARLTINDQHVNVAPNGAFLAFMPIPADGTFRFEAKLGSRTATQRFTYAQPGPPVPSEVATEMLVKFTTPQLARVVAGRDTLDSGSGIASAAPTPDGDRRWFFPIGSEVVLTGQLGSLYRIQLTDSTEGWLDTPTVDIERSGGYRLAPIGPVRILPQAHYTDVTLPVDFAPFHINAQVRHLDLTVYGRTRAPGSITPDGVVKRAVWISTSQDSSQLLLDLNEGLWGFKAFYERNGDLVIRIRHAPDIDPDQPLRGLHILVDPGHPPGGAIGPTGLKEADANLNISLRIADMLRERGATVLMTRQTPEPLVSDTSASIELLARVDTSVALNVDLLISVHNNAFPEGINPFKNFGTEAYYYHAFSAPLAYELLREIRSVTGIPNLGAKKRSLALVRPTWFPSTLTESLFMMFPRQEAALRNPDFLDRLAAAHVNGIVSYLQRYLEFSRN